MINDSLSLMSLLQEESKSTQLKPQYLVSSSMMQKTALHTIRNMLIFLLYDHTLMKWHLEETIHHPAK